MSQLASRLPGAWRMASWSSVARKIVIRLLLCLVSLAAFATTIRAQQPGGSPGASAGVAGDEKVDFPSPDGTFAFLMTYGDDLHSIDLIDRNSGRKLQRISEEDSDRISWHLLWAPDSKRFALMTRLGHPIQGVDVYARRGEVFRKLELPQLPAADIPDRLKHGRTFPHVASLNWQEAKAWKADGSLVVSIDTMIDGAGGSITATRTVVLGFDRAGKARIMKSTIKYETERD
jgi:hypothetical protein